MRKTLFRFFCIFLLFVVYTQSQKVSVEYYSDSECLDLVNTVDWLVGEKCVESDTKPEFSGSHFTCFKDILCYDLFENSTTCNSTEPAMGYSTYDCTAPINGATYYSRIISGTETCDDAPDDYSCNISLGETDNEEETEPILVPRDYTILIFLTCVFICETIAIIRAVMLYRRGPLPVITAEELTMADLSADSLNLDDPFSLDDDDLDITV